MRAIWRAQTDFLPLSIAIHQLSPFIHSQHNRSDVVGSFKTRSLALSLYFVIIGFVVFPFAFHSIRAMTNSWASLIILAALSAQAVLGQLAFPEKMEINQRKANLKGRIPLYAPSQCKKHELLYPGDQESDWICDCAPAALYYPESDACFPAFRQGPCENGEFLVLSNNGIIPQCIKNDCKVDGQVMIQKVCYQLDRPGPCPNAQLSYVLGVNPETLHIDCVKLSISVESRFGEESSPPYDLAKVDICPRGCKRAVQGRCPEVKQVAST